VQRFLLTFGLLPVLLLPAAAQGFDFVPAPHQGLNRVYRIDRTTGEVGACQFGLRDGGIGLTLCYPAGDGAKAGPAGDYGLIASRHNAEAGIFRVNRRTGEMSICYVLNDEKVVCTAPGR
jgi:hypothetical protein